MKEELAPEWADPNNPAGDSTEEVRVGQIVHNLVTLAREDEAQTLLGTNGTLENNLDLMFVGDALVWIANDIAQAIRLEDDETDGVSLSSVVAALRLYQLIHGAPDEVELTEAVLDYLDDSSQEL